MRKTIIRKVLFILFVINIIILFLSSTFYFGLDKEGTDEIVVQITLVILIVSLILSLLFGLVPFIYNFIILQKVTKIYTINIKEEHKYDQGLESLKKYSKYFTSLMVEEYIKLYTAYTILRLADYDNCKKSLIELYEYNVKNKGGFLFSFFPLYYLSLISYIKDEENEMKEYISKSKELIDKRKKSILNRKHEIYSNQFKIISALEKNDKENLKNLILAECDGDPNKLTFVKDVYKK